ncbi:response regulator transcription factor [Phycisphaera mikurensis]|uniref:Putative LuxR family two-component system response regulator n=1 Tax=Phycisphaera mikurensis (strain NBRC 102666 / KCTC 22515 / FYK2301M01) TaxID=1142394 RepID=I0IGI4_PHYMF|nr:response regulator transcription factor [Phycisphaera mikurensis]MBB6442947.1 DNA-binding NarL/FixJ family response regulator [Phycisphaera mikurensis]BAM04372.1 putative LuxR family two-component system response regulator [Phycisphaera mikurensis NBRC 102666]
MPLLRSHPESPPAGAARTVRVVLVDDHPIVRRGLAELINDESDLDVVGEASSIAEAHRELERLKPDVALVDLSLGDGHGLELIKQINGNGWKIRMLVCSMLDESLYVDRVLRAGASGYLRKDLATDHIVAAVRRVAAGEVYLSEAAAARVATQKSTDGEPGPSAVEQLSDRELEVFEMIGDGMGSREIAATLHLSVKTVETYREKIKAKLRLKNGNELTRHAIHERIRKSEQS